MNKLFREVGMTVPKRKRTRVGWWPLSTAWNIPATLLSSWLYNKMKVDRPASKWCSRGSMFQ